MSTSARRGTIEGAEGDGGAVVSEGKDITMTPLPHVILHTAIALDGATTGFTPDLSTFYGLIEAWDEDITLVGADTILAQQSALRSQQGPGPTADGPALAVVDSRCRVSAWHELRDAGPWSHVLAVRGRHSAPPPVGTEVLTGTDRVDLRAALRILREDHGAQTIRVDSGGTLAGVLLDLGLIDEISLLLHPLMRPDESTRWFGRSTAHRSIERMRSEQVGDGLLWIRGRPTTA